MISFPEYKAPAGRSVCRGLLCHREPEWVVRLLLAGMLTEALVVSSCGARNSAHLT